MATILDFKPKDYMAGEGLKRIHENYNTMRHLVSSMYQITVDNSSANTHNINIDRPHFTCFAINEAEAVGQMILSDFKYKHLPIVKISAT